MIAFVILGALILTAAFWVVSLSNLFRAALSLGLVLIGVAGLFILLEAEFLAFVQILIYVGAILILIIFAIMLTARMQADAAQPASPGSSQSTAGASRNRVAAAAAALSVFGLLAWTTQAVNWTAFPAASSIATATLGQRLVTHWVLPFEVVSLVFVAVITGAVAIVSRCK